MVDVSKKLAQCDQLVKQEDQSAKFVTLFLILEILSTNPDPVTALQCWKRTDGRMLDKLLLAAESSEIASAEATDFTSLSLSVLHAFAGFEIVRKQKSFQKRSEALLKFVVRHLRQESESGPGFTEQAMMVLSTMVIASDGAIHVLTSKRFVPFVSSILHAESLEGLHLLAFCIDTALSNQLGVRDLISYSIVDLLDAIVNHSWQKDAFLKAVPTVNAAMLQTVALPIADDRDMKLKSLVKAAFLSPSRSASYADALLLMTVILQKRGVEWLNLEQPDERKFLMVLGSMAAAEIRARLSEMARLDQLDPAQFSDVAEVRLSSNYDLIHCICIYLAATEDLTLSPEQILRLRDDFSAAFGETILYLKERFDRSAHSNIEAIFKHEGNADEDMVKSPCIIACTKALCFWIEEDESLHKQASHLCPVFVHLIHRGRAAGLDYYSWILPALACLVLLDEGKNGFNTSNGWPVVETHMVSLAQQARRSSSPVNLNMLDEADQCLCILKTVNPERYRSWCDRHDDLLMLLDSMRGS